MPGIARDAGVDSAGGPIIEGSPNVFANESPVARVGDAVAGHGRGSHARPVMADGSPNEPEAIRGIRAILHSLTANEVRKDRQRQRLTHRLGRRHQARGVFLYPGQSAVCGKRLPR